MINFTLSCQLFEYMVNNWQFTENNQPNALRYRLDVNLAAIKYCLQHNLDDTRPYHEIFNHETRNYTASLLAEHFEQKEGVQ